MSTTKYTPPTSWQHERLSELILTISLFHNAHGAVSFVMRWFRDTAHMENEEILAFLRRVKATKKGATFWALCEKKKREGDGVLVVYLEQRVLSSRSQSAGCV